MTAAIVAPTMAALVLLLSVRIVRSFVCVAVGPRVASRDLRWLWSLLRGVTRHPFAVLERSSRSSSEITSEVITQGGTGVTRRTMQDGPGPYSRRVDGR